MRRILIAFCVILSVCLSGCTNVYDLLIVNNTNETLEIVHHVTVVSFPDEDKIMGSVKPHAIKVFPATMTASSNLNSISAFATGRRERKTVRLEWKDSHLAILVQ